MKDKCLQCQMSDKGQNVFKIIKLIEPMDLCKNPSNL